MSLTSGQILGIIVALILLGIVFIAAKNKF